MELDFFDSEREFRDEVRTWLDEHLVGDFAAHRGVGSPTDDEAWELRVEWERELASGHWLGVTWPEEYGGRGASELQETVFEYEYARAAAPARVNTQGLKLLGPTLLLGPRRRSWTKTMGWTPGNARFCSAGPRRSTAVRQRFSATSSPSGC